MFSGESGASAEKELRKFEYDMHGLKDAEGNIGPSDYLTCGAGRNLGGQHSSSIIAGAFL